MSEGKESLPKDLRSSVSQLLTSFVQQGHLPARLQKRLEDPKMLGKIIEAVSTGQTADGLMGSLKEFGISDEEVDWLVNQGEFDSLLNAPFEQHPETPEEVQERLGRLQQEARKRLNWETVRKTEKRIGRNDPCSCGSGKKFKKCCGGRH